jgi:hypothetical protein
MCPADVVLLSDAVLRLVLGWCRVFALPGIVAASPASRLEPSARQSTETNYMRGNDPAKSIRASTWLSTAAAIASSPAAIAVAPPASCDGIWLAALITPSGWIEGGACPLMPAAASRRSAANML